MTTDDLKQWRASLGLSQRAAAEALGVTLATFQSWERGRLTELACKYLALVNAASSS